ncbi:twin-arginine translocation pathway signal protein, partial [Nonomuraea sp. FMUSA5-5]|nr:twin-arginine translocation pathway signal protein [Nonomuraea sp. FMUSA5-5]
MTGISRRAALTVGAAALAAPAATASAASAQERPFRAVAGLERPAQPNVLFIF